MMKNRFSIIERIKSFGFAFSGLKILFRDEPNAWIHFIAALCVVIAGFLLKISAKEWIVIVFAIGFVVSMEIINSAIEKITDFISPEKNDSIKKIKDLAAASVLISALTALIIGVIIFLPKIFRFFQVH